MILSKEPDGDLYGLLALAVTTLTHCALTTRGRSRNTFHDRSESRCPPLLLFIIKVEFLLLGKMGFYICFWCSIASQYKEIWGNLFLYFHGTKGTDGRGWSKKW